MGWFRKKPSMQERRASLGLIPGNPIATHRYIPLLRDAVNGAAIYREPSEIADDMGVGHASGSEQERIILQTVAGEFSSLKLRIARLEEVRPDTVPLLDVHVAACDYLQQFLRTSEYWNTGLAQEFGGNLAEAKRLYAKSDRAGNELQALRQRLAIELRRLARADSRLYAELAIQQQTLVRLSLT